MSSQTVVDVVISGTTATVVDAQVDGITTVAGAPQVTNVSGQIPDLGVTTSYLAGQGEILSLTNDIANLRANVIITGQTLTDEIGVLSGVLISTGNYLESNILTLSGDLIASGNNLDSLRDILSGNLITTGQSLQTQITNNDSDIASLVTNLITTGQTLQTQITSNDGDIATLTSNLVATGQTLTTDINTVSTNLISTGEVVDDISGNLITTGQTLQTQITSNDGDITTLTSDVSTLTSNVVTTGQTLQTQITSNDSDIATLDSTTVKLTTNQSIAGNKIFSDKVTINNLHVTGTEVIVDVENLAVKDNLIHINSGESGAGISRISGGITIDRGTEPSANILYNDANDRFELNFPLALEGNLAVTANQTGVYASAVNLVTTGQTLQTQITSNDGDISTLTTNLATTGATLTSEVGIVSGLITDNDGDITALKTATGVLKTSTDANTSNLITTGNFLTSEINIVSGLAGGSVINELSGDLITTGQTLQVQITSNDSDISTLTSNLVTTGQTLTSEIATVSGIAEAHTDVTALSGKVDDISGNLITTGQTLQTQITSNDGDITTLTSNLITTGQTLTSEIAIVSGIATGGSAEDFAALSGDLITTGQTLQTQITSNDSDISTLTSNLITTGQTLTTDINTVSTSLISTGAVVDDISGNLITTGQTLQTQITSNDSDISTLTSNLISTGSVVDDISGNLITTGQTLTTSINTNSSNLITTGQTLTSEIAIVSGIAEAHTDVSALSGKVDDISGNLITTGQTLQTQITSNDTDISNLTANLISTGTIVDDISGNLITTGQTLQTQITSNDGDITTLTSNLITTGQTLTSEIGTVSGLITDNDAEIAALLAATGELKTDTNRNASNLITTGQTLTTNINTVSTNLVSTGSIVDDISGNLITTGQTLQTQITSNDGDITNLTSNLITTGQTLTTEITTVSGLITDNDGDITALKAATGVLKTSTDNNTANLISTGAIVDDISGNLITTGQTLQTQITSNDSDISTLTSNLISTGSVVDDISGNLITTGQTLQTQITSNDSDISTLTSNLVSTGSVVDDISGNLITTGQTLQTQITSNDGDISTLTTNLGTTGQTLQTQITSNDADIATLDSTTVKLTTNQSVAGNKIFTDTVTINNLTVTGTEVVVDVENLAVKDNIIHINSGESGAGISRISGGITIDRGTEPAANILYNDANDRFELNFPLATEGNVVASAANLITTGQTLQTQITSNDGDITTLTTNLGTTGQTLQTQITSNDSDISTLTSNLSTTNSNLVTTGQTLTTNINTVSTNLVSTGSIVDDISGNLITTGQTLQTQITSNDTDITNLSSNLVTTGQTLTTNINTVANNLVTTGQTLTSEIATVSGLIPATVIDGGGTANKVPLWSDANTIGDSVISQSSSKIGIGTATPSVPLHVSVDGTAEILLERTTGLSGMPSQIRVKSVGSEWSLANNLAGLGKFSIRDVTDSRHVMVFDGEGVVTTNKLEPLNGNDTGYLGSSSKKWKEVYFGILEADTATFSGALNFNNGSDNCLRIEADAGKDAYINSYGSGNFIQFKQNSAAVLSLYETFLAIPDSTQLRFGGGSDLRFYHDGNNSYIWQVGVGALNIKSSVTDGNIVFTADRGDGGGTFDYFSVNGGDTTYAGGVTTAYTKWPDNSRIALGGGKDLQLYHDGSNSHIKNTGSLYVASETSGDLYLRSDDDIFIQPQGGENGITLTGNGAVTLYYDNAVKLATVSTGITVTGAGTFSTSLKAATILDASNSAGTSGQILTSTGSALDWKTLGEISGVDGTGTAGYLSKWTDADTIGNSVIVESSSKIGIGTATPEVPLEVVFSRGAKTSLTDIWGLRSENTGDVAGTQAGLTFIVNNASSARAWAGIYAEQTNTDDTSLKFWNEKANSRTVKMTINSDGNVGIGSENPAYKLDVRGDYIFVDDGKGIRFGGSSHQVTRETGNELRLKAANTTGFITFLTGGGTEYMRIAADGKVGIGTNAPTSKLHTYVTADHNYLTIENSTANQAALQWKTSTTNADWIAYIPTSSSDLRLYSGGDLVTFKTDGKVGIGTSPVYAFEVVAGTNEVVFEHDTHANGTQTIKFNPSSTKAGGISKIYSSYAGTGATEGKLALGTYSAQTALTIDNGGRVGINNTSPSNRFEVSGTSKFTGNVNIGAAGAGWDALFQSTTSGQYWEWDASMSLTRYRDNTKAVFGNGDDLEIYHDGSHSYIKDTGTGNLVLATSRLSINNAASNEEMISAIQNGAVELFYANSKKLETTSTGVTVTGGVVATSTIQVSRSSASPLFQVTDADAGGGAKSRWFGLVDGTSRFAIYGTNGSTEEFKLDDGGAATFSGALTAGTTNYQIQTSHSVGNDSAIITRAANADNKHLEFRAKNANYNQLFLSTTGRVGIGDNGPDYTLDVAGTFRATGIGIFGGALEASSGKFTTTNNQLTIFSSGTQYGYWNQNIVGFKNAAGVVRTDGPSDLKLQTNSTDRLTIHGSTGAVGIGTSAPNVRFHVETSVADVLSKFINTDGTNGHGLLVKAGGSASGKYIATFRDAANNTRMHLLADGKVGIGTTAPSAPLHVNETNTTAEAATVGRFSTTSGGAFKLMVDDKSAANPKWGIETGGGEAIEIRPASVSSIFCATDGKVGIGTATPDAHKLTVVGGDDAEGTVHFHQNVATNNPTLYIQQVGEGGNAGNTTGLLIKCDGQNGGLSHLIRAIGTNSNVNSGTDVDAFAVRNDGKIGIGTTAPLSLLDVFFTSSRRLLANYDDSLITLKASNNSSNPENLRLVADDIIFNTGTSGSGSERMRITDAGKVGIGTTAPAKPVHVNVETGWATLRLEGASDSGGEIEFYKSSTKSGSIFFSAAGDCQIRPLGVAEKFIILANGKVGIGNTPKSWSTLFDVLQIGYSGALAGRQGDSSNQMDVMNNVYYDGAFKRINAGYASRFTQNHVGDFEFFTAGTAAADSSISFTESMTILNDGTLDLKSAKFKINGSAGSSGQTLTTDGSGNISWSSAGSGTISGSGTDNYVPRFNGTTALQNSAIFSNDSGSVGIGCADPTSRLTVEKTSTATTLSKDGTVLMLRGADGANKYSHIGFTYDIAGDVQPSATIGIQLTSWTASTKSDLVFGTRDVTTDTAPTERMRITSAGKVGIGTNAPSVHLDVYTAVGWGVVDIDGASGGELRFQKAGTTWLDIYGNDSSYAVLKATSHLSIYVNGSTLAAYFKSDGKVGIGTNAPATLLHVRGAYSSGSVPHIRSEDSTDSSFVQMYMSSSNGGYLETSSGKMLRLAPAGSTKMAVLTDGNVGIGTTAPSRLIDVYSGSDDTAWIRATYGTTTSVEIGAHSAAAYLSSGTGDDIRISPAGSTRLIIKVDGKIGIGTIAPAATLHTFVSGGPNEFRMQAHRNDVGQNMFSTYFSRGTSASPTIVQNGDTLLEIQPKGYDGANYHRAAEIDFQVDGTPGTNDMPGRIMFWTTADGASAPTERMRITSTGNVGIGTTAPGAALEVAKTSADASLKVNRTDQTNIQLIAAGSSYVRASAALILQSNGANNRLTLATDGAATFSGTLTANDNININKADGIVYLNSAGTGNSGCYVRGLSGGAMRFQSQSYYEWEVTGNLKMKFTADGKLGIGTNAPAAALHVAPDNNNNDGAIKVGARAWFSHSDGGQTHTWVANDYNSDASQFGIRMKGVAESNEVFTVLGNGKVGIGTASPGSLLHVYGGNIKISSTDDKPQLVFGEAAADRWVIGNSNAPNNYFAIGEGSDIALNERLVIAPTTGKVGIGITAPTAFLHVYGSEASQWAAYFENVSSQSWGLLVRGGADSADYSFLVRDYNQNDLFTIRGNGNVGIGTNGPDAPLHVARASDYKVIKLGDDITSHYVMTGNSDHTLTLTCGSYYQAEIIVTAHQTNGGTYNNLYIRGIWSNNDTSHHWDEIENVGSLTNSTFTITNGQNGATTNSGEWKIVHDYVSGTFVKFTVRVTDFYGTHAYTIS